MRLSASSPSHLDTRLVTGRPGALQVRLLSPCWSESAESHCWSGVPPASSRDRLLAAALTAEAHAFSERGQTVTRSAGSTYGRPRGKTIETGESWSTQVPPIVSLPHPGITQTESICVDPIVALTGRSRFRDHGLTALGVIESGIA